MICGEIFSYVTFTACLELNSSQRLNKEHSVPYTLMMNTNDEAHLWVVETSECF